MKHFMVLKNSEKKKNTKIIFYSKSTIMLNFIKISSFLGYSYNLDTGNKNVMNGILLYFIYIQFFGVMEQRDG